MCFGLFTNAQYLVNQGANIVINSGSSLVIDGDFRNELDGAINNSGNMLITGDFINNQTSGSLLSGTTGFVRLTGTIPQTISGSAIIYFSNLELQNDAILASNVIAVSSSLTLTSSYFTLSNGVLVVQYGSPIIGASSSGYIVTNGNGHLRQLVSASDVIYPIGTASAFAPIVLNNSGSSDYYSIRTFPDVRTNGLTGATIPEINDCVNMTWDILENSFGGSNLSVTPYWSAAMEGTNFDRAHCGVGHYTGGSWDPQEEVPAAGIGTYSITRTGITTLSAFAVGDLESPMAFPVDLRLDLAAFLEGPFNGVDMDNDLNSSGYLPASQPYNVAPWSYPGTETVVGLPAGWVDWVLIEIRDAPNAASATPATTVARKAALLLQDGSIVDVDGSTLPSFSSISITNQLFAVVWHRNHLGIMSSSPLANIGGTYSYDFTLGPAQAYLAGQKNLGGGFGMYGGDGNANSGIGPADELSVWQPQAGTNGYKQGDFNLDGEVNNPDKNDSWAENLGTSSQVPN